MNAINMIAALLIPCGIVFSLTGGLLYPNRNIGVYYAVKVKPKTKREIIALWIFFVGMIAWAIGMIAMVITSLI